MGYKTYEEIKEKLCRELGEYEGRGDLGTGDLDVLHKLTDTIKNIDKILMLEEEGYSDDGGEWEARGSYAGRKRDSMGRYSRDMGRDTGRGGSSYRNGSSYRRGMGYSRAEGKEELMKHLEKAMDEAESEETRDAIRRCIKEVESE